MSGVRPCAVSVMPEKTKPLLGSRLTLGTRLWSAMMSRVGVSMRLGERRKAVMLSLPMLAKQLDVSLTTLNRRAVMVEAPKPDDYILHTRGLSPRWTEDRLSEWRTYFELYPVRKQNFGKHNTRCRCDGCYAKRSRENAARSKERRAGRKLIDGRIVHPDAPHGKISGYINWGCHCEPCDDVGRAYVKQQERRH